MDHAEAAAEGDANFWRPSQRRVGLAPGTPFFFKLRSPANAVAGFGFFAGFTVLPDWLAWETFGEANGVGSFAELRERLERIQERGRIAPDPQRRIGCCMIAEVRFFPRGEWVAQPSDWRVRTQAGAGYDLDQGEGRRIWEECVARVAGEAALPAGELHDGGGPRWGSPVLVQPRLGQPIFRVQVLDAYGRACAVTGEHSLPVLEAAHIVPYAQGGAHAVPNGLALRSDLHRLFDKGYVTVDEDSRFVVGHRLRDDFENGRSYYGLQGQALALPAAASLRPSPQALEWHRSAIFLG